MLEYPKAFLQIEVEPTLQQLTLRPSYQDCFLVDANFHGQALAGNEVHLPTFLILLAIVPALILLILGVRGFKRAIQLKDRFDEHYFLRLNTPAGQLDVFGSQDKKSLDTIAHAIRSSISSAVN